MLRKNPILCSFSLQIVGCGVSTERLCQAKLSLLPLARSSTQYLGRDIIQNYLLSQKCELNM